MSRIHYTDTMHELDQKVLKMGILVIEAIKKSIQGLCSNDMKLLESVKKDDKIINMLEFDIDDKCTLLIATEQPVAQDLRHLISVLKIVTQLERMGDHAADISKVGLLLNKNLEVLPVERVRDMTNIVVKMTDEVMSAFLHVDDKKAVEICALDDEVDTLNYSIQKDAFALINNGVCNPDEGLKELTILRFLERIADQVTNIAEWIVFEVRGEHEDLNT